MRHDRDDRETGRPFRAHRTCRAYRPGRRTAAVRRTVHVPHDGRAVHAGGTNETLLDPKLGYSMPPGSKLVMQIHYNTLNVGDTPASDRSGIRLRVTDRPLQELRTVLFPAPVELPCTKQESGPLCDRAAAVKDVGRRFGEQSQRQVARLTEFCGPPVAGPTQHCDQPVHGTAVLHAVAGHMHLLGRAIKIELNPGTAKARTLLDVPNYDFDDQALRPLAKPVRSRTATSYG